MKKLTSAFVLILIFFNNHIHARATDTTAVIRPVNLSGPRFGVTYLAADAYTKLRDWTEDVNPVTTQFGWQVETRFFTLPSGTVGMVEWVFLIGGMDQNLFLPSASCLVGIRNARGMELGFGPNLSISGVAFAFAAGVTLRSSHVNFPINLAFVPSKNGGRIGLLFGFNTRHR